MSHLCKAERIKQCVCLIRRDTEQRVCVWLKKMCVCVLTGVFISMGFIYLCMQGDCVGVMSDASLLSMANRIVMVTEHILYHLPCN